MNVMRACLAILIPVAVYACDLPPKDLGNESESNSGSAGGTDDGGTPCAAGDTKPSDDGCNTCACLDGQWACTERACADEGPPVCSDGDTMPDADGCNECTCIDGAWACTDLACGTDDGTMCQDGDTMPAPDGCNTCTCEDGQWGCTEIACDNGWFGDEILVCDPGAPQDALSITTAAIQDDALVLDVSYGGGCMDHDFGLCWDGAFAESSPVQIQAFVAHDGHDDPCDAVPSEQLAFDLLPLQQAWQDAYQSEHGDVEIHLAGWAEAILYSF